MSSNTQGSGSPQGTSTSTSGGSARRDQQEEWVGVTDPNQRRKIQNKLAQRRYRDKVKEQKDETEREEENQRQAGGAYVSPEPEEIDSSQNLSGLPWGGISMRHIVETGKTRDQGSQRSSRANSVQGATSRTGGSSRLGLHLTDQFARGIPAWKAYRYFPYRNFGPRS